MAFKKIDFASLNSKRAPKADNKTIIASAPRDFGDTELIEAGLAKALELLAINDEITDAGTDDGTDDGDEAVKPADDVALLCRDEPGADKAIAATADRLRPGITVEACAAEWRDANGNFVRSAAFDRNRHIAFRNALRSGRTKGSTSISVIFFDDVHHAFDELNHERGLDKHDLVQLSTVQHLTRALCYNDDIYTHSNEPVFIAARVTGEKYLIPRNDAAFDMVDKVSEEDPRSTMLVRSRHYMNDLCDEPTPAILLG